MVLVLTLWLMPRYGYHISIHFLILHIQGCVSAICSLFNTFMPGKDVAICSLAIQWNHWNDIISGTLHMPTVNQWLLTIYILTTLATISFYLCEAAFNPMTNLADWAFLSIPTTSLSIFLWFLCKYYVDTYVKLGKI